MICSFGDLHLLTASDALHIEGLCSRLSATVGGYLRSAVDTIRLLKETG
jgi:hypothetical protein